MMPQQEQLPYGYDVAAVVRHSAFEPCESLPLQGAARRARALGV